MYNEFQVAKEIIEAMPDEQPPRGQKPNWGTAATRIRAYVQAARHGMKVSTECNNCDADVYDKILEIYSNGSSN